MPTRPPPSLKHRPFDWGKSEVVLEKALQPRLEELLRFSGFFDECGINTLLEFSSEHVINEAKHHFDRLIGILLKAAAVRIDSGFKPKSQVISTLRAIARNPRLMIASMTKIEPEAAGALASNYQRDHEPPGTHWYDVLERGIRGLQPPKTEKIREAARRAIELIGNNTVEGDGRPDNLNIMTKYRNGKPRKFGRGTLSLADDLRKWITTYGKKPKRTVYADPHGDSITLSSIDQLIAIVIPPLNQIVSERGAKKFSSATLIKEICGVPDAVQSNHLL